MLAGHLGGDLDTNPIKDGFSRLHMHGAIFAIIAIFSQEIFAISAMALFAIIANCNQMKDLQKQQKAWLKEQLVEAGHGSRTKLAKFLRVGTDAITRMTNIDRGEPRDIKMHELLAMAEYFKKEPPGMQAPEHAADDRLVQRVPLLDRVPAGKLAAPMSQIGDHDIPYMTFTHLGRGDFIALTVNGNSMDRVSPEGSVIIVNRADKTLVSGRCYVFSHRGETTYKRWRGGDPPYLEPFSTDPSHRPIFIKRKRDIEVVGRVKRSVLEL